MNTRILSIGVALFVATILPAQASMLGDLLNALVGGTPATSARPPLLANGTVAPDFSVLRTDNTSAKLSDYHGKVVLVDFWATWCGPCKVSMPHLEKVHQALKDQGLIVLGVCVWDERTKFDDWMKKPEVPTSYLKVFDPAGKTTANSIAAKFYQVSGIPTFYLIDKDGKILFSAVGSGKASEVGLDQALTAAGFKL